MRQPVAIKPEDLIPNQNLWIEFVYVQRDHGYPLPRWNLERDLTKEPTYTGSTYLRVKFLEMREEQFPRVYVVLPDHKFARWACGLRALDSVYLEDPRDSIYMRFQAIAQECCNVNDR